MQVAPEIETVQRRADEVTCPGEKLDGVGRLLVARTDRLGDLLLTLPALAALRRGYPGAELELLVAPALAELAACFPGVDHIEPAPAGSAELTELLERRRPDAMVCIARNGRLAVAGARAGVAHRVGTGRRFYSPLFTRRVEESRRGGGRHEVEYALSFAHRIGAPAGPAQFDLRVPDASRAAVAAWLRERGLTEGGFVVLHPGSGGSCPSWGEIGYRELARLHREEDRSVVWSAGPDDEVPADEAPCFSGSLPELAALLAAAAGVVSNSTGPLHLAVALGRPALAIHAPWPACSVARWGPYSSVGAGIVATTPGAGEWSRRRRGKRAAQLMGGVPAALVFAEACRRFATDAGLQR